MHKVNIGCDGLIKGHNNLSNCIEGDTYFIAYALVKNYFVQCAFNTMKSITFDLKLTHIPRPRYYVSQ